MLLPTLALFLLAAPPAFHVDVIAPGANKPKMILIPGLQSDGAVWSSTVTHFKDRYECHVLTLAGFAGQPSLPAGQPFLETVRDQLAAYIRDHRMKSPVIVGHSLGGFLALWLSAENPGLTGPLVIVDSLPFLPGAYLATATAESMKDQATSLRAMVGSMQGDAWVTYQKGNPSLKSMMSNDADIALATEWGIKSDPKTVATAMFELFQTDLRTEVSRIQSPTLLLAALKGYPEGSIQIYQTQTQPLKNMRLEAFPEARHFIMFDAPARMFETMDSFLKAAK
jgi:pimeloyl-ACP methyl ester carboxylesterase